jgi:hypothetical protein
VVGRTPVADKSMWHPISTRHSSSMYSIPRLELRVCLLCTVLRRILLTQEGSVRLSPRIRRQDKIRRVNVKREPQYNIESSTARIQTSFPSSPSSTSPAYSRTPASLPARTRRHRIAHAYLRTRGRRRRGLSPRELRVNGRR